MVCVQGPSCMGSTSRDFSNKKPPQPTGALAQVQHGQQGHLGDLTPRVPAEDPGTKCASSKQHYQGSSPPAQPPPRVPGGGPSEKSLVEGDWGSTTRNTPEEKTEQ